MKTIFYTGALALTACLWTSCQPGGSGGGSIITLTFPHVLNVDHPVHQAIEKFAEEVEARSEGTMRVKVFPGGSMGTEQELIDNVASGSNDMTKISSTVMETKSELAKVYSMPFLFRDGEHFWQVANGEIGRELLDMALDQKIKGVCYFDAGARSFYTKEKIESPAGLAGKKIRVQKSIMMGKLMSALDALPQQIAWAELYTALDTGVVWGAENNIPSYYTTQHFKVAPFYAFDEHVRIPDMVFMNADRWNSLSPEQQQILMDSAQLAVEFQRELWRQKRTEYIEQMKADGVRFSYPDKKPFQDKMRSIYNEFEGTPVMEYVERIRAVE